MKTPYLHQQHALTAISNAVKLTINLPTGTGKSLIQAWAIAEDIKKHPDEIRVEVVLCPRILLASQLYADIKEGLINLGLDVQYAIVNSGNKKDNDDFKWFETIRKLEKAQGIEYRDLPVCRSVEALNEVYDKCVRENVSLVIIGTYQSAQRIQSAKFNVNNLHCDEAHYLVPGKEEESKDFSWIVEGLVAERKYFYTATMRFTNGVYGMNNAERFGELFQRLPIELIQAGRIIRPRIHLVDVDTKDDMSVEARDAVAIVDAFREHQAMLSANGIQHLAAKILVVAKGSQHLDDVLKQDALQQLMADRPNLTVFDITSKHQARINGVVTSREEFLKRLKALGDHDEAIIMHVRILCEGIDVPGITGIMPLNNLRKSAFLQTLGRATRLHSFDRQRIDNGLIPPDALKRFVKPYAWIIIPIYEDLGEEMKEDFTEMVKDLRTYGFNPAEDIFIRESRGESLPKPLSLTTSPNKKTKSYSDFFTFNVVHIIEEEEIAERIDLKRALAKTIKTEEELFANFDKFITF